MDIAEPAVASEVRGAVGYVTLANDARRNALSLATMHGVTAALDALDRDPAVRVVVIRANGAVFSAGHDLRELRTRETSDLREIFTACVEMVTRIRTVAAPVVAEVRGVATAAGCQLVASCDLAVAARGATFATPGVRIGLFCSTPMIALSRAIGRKRAMEMLLTGTPIDAETAADWGLVNRVVDEDRLASEVAALAERIASAAASTVALGKAAFYAQLEMDEPSAYAYAAEVMTENARSADAQEGIAAFLERRAPRWTT